MAGLSWSGPEAAAILFRDGLPRLGPSRKRKVNGNDTEKGAGLSRAVRTRRGDAAAGEAGNGAVRLVTAMIGRYAGRGDVRPQERGVCDIGESLLIISTAIVH